jgi:hypothetical protein
MRVVGYAVALVGLGALFDAVFPLGGGGVFPITVIVGLAILFVAVEVRIVRVKTSAAQH